MRRAYWLCCVVAAGCIEPRTFVAMTGDDSGVGVDAADGPSDGPDATLDGPDAMADGPIDAPPIDAPIDAPVDAPIDAPIDAATDAPTDAPIDGPGDTDGDGIADLIDNCDFVVNLRQDDDDGDGAGDVCDLCPQRPGTPINLDSDAIGDACGDPSTTTSTDRQCIVWYDGFDRDTSARYAPVGSWSIGGEFAGGGSASGATSLTIIGPTFAHPHVRTEAIIGSLGPLPAFTDVARVGVRGNDLGAAYYQSVIDKRGSDDFSRINLNYAGPAGQSLDKDAVLGASLAANARITVTLDVRTQGSLYNGVAAGVVDVSSASVRENNLGNLAGGSASLRAERLMVRFDYLMVLIDEPAGGCPVRTEP